MSHATRDSWRPLALPKDEPAEAAPGLWCLPKLRSPELQNYRDIIVAVPPSYDATTRNHPLIVMHDGQNLFDPDTSYAGAWGMLGVMRDLAAAGLDFVVAAIANTGPFRRYEYSPFRDPRHGGGDGDRYLTFVIDQVIPRVESTFRVDRDPARRSIAGSSMGGLVSLYALWKRPDAFGAAAALSPSAWFADEAIIDFVKARPAPPGRLWLDTGAEEGDLMVDSVRRLRDAIVHGGLTEGPRFEYVEDEGASHHEEHWGRRMRAAIPFLVGLSAGPPARRPAKEQ
jgi:predicted alpha/beta superfamily hydrolase